MRDSQVKGAGMTSEKLLTKPPLKQNNLDIG